MMKLRIRPVDVMWLALLVTALGGLALLGQTFVSAQSRNQALEQQITRQINDAALLARRTAAVTRELGEADVHIAQLRADMPAAVPEVELLAFIQRSAVESGVRISSVQWEPPKGAGVKDSTLAVGKLRISASADLPQLVTLVDKLERGHYKSMVVDDVKGGTGDSVLTVSVYTLP